MNQRLTKETRLTLRKAAGFTLIELMIAIVLGLLVVAAATDLFLGGLVGLRLQQGGADAQDNGLFGLDYVAKDIRLTNYGNLQNLVMNDKSTGGGIVLTADTAPGVSVANLTGVRMSNSATDYVPSGLLSRGPGGTTSANVNEWQGLTKVLTPSTAKSDQLTFQYVAPIVTTDCQGVAAAAGVTIVERLFLRVDANDANSLVLACDAGRVTPGAIPVLSGMGTAAPDKKEGAVIMSHVEHFHVLLSVVKLDGTYVNYNISDYMGIVGAKPQIQAVQIGVLVRSTENTSSAAIDPTQTFKVLDQNVTVAATNANSNHYVRRVYTTTIALRNGFGSPS
jgi:type IV pilus assembly protein PilW